MSTTTIAATTVSDSSKKRRIEEKEVSKKVLNPFNEAKEQLDIVSPSLPPELRTSLTKAMHDILSNLHLCSQKNATLKRLKDEEVIPKSLASKFELQSSKFIKESTEFTSLQEEVKELQEEHAKKLKEKIIKVNTLDRDASFRAAIDIILDNALKMAKFYYQYDYETKWRPCHIMEIIDDVFHKVDQMKLFFQAAEYDSRAICRSLLKIIEDDDDDKLTVLQRSNLKPTRDNFNKMYKMSIEAVVVRYKDAVKEKIKLTRATKALREHEADKIAAETTTGMDTEPKYDPDAVRQICKEEVQVAMSKNKSGGKSTAAKKKKNRQNQQKKGQNNKKQEKKGQGKKNQRKGNQGDPNNGIKSVLRNSSTKKSNKKNKGRKASFNK